MKEEKTKRIYIIRIIEYMSIFVGLFLVFLYLRGVELVLEENVHFAIEVAASMTLLFVAGLSLMIYSAKKIDKFLFFGLIFFGVFFLGLYHSFVISFFHDPHADSELHVHLGWESSRFFLITLIIVGWFAWDKSGKRWGESFLSRNIIMWGVPALFAVFLIFFQIFSARGVEYFPEYLQDFLGALLFLLAFVLYFSKGEWRKYFFEHWMVIFLLVGFMSQLVHIFSSESTYDVMHDAGHVLAFASYVCFLIGILVEAHFLLSEVEEKKFELAVEREKGARIATEKEKIKEIARKSKKEIEEALMEAEKGKRELEKMNKMMVGREMRMIELKKELAILKKKCGEV